MDKGKRYKKGELLFKEGDSTDKLYIIERGKVSLNVERNGTKINLLELGKTQVLGEQSIFSNSRQVFNAEAMQETVVMEVPIELIKSQLSSSPPGVKLVMKSMVDEVKQGRQAMKSIRMSQDSSPCPQVSIPRIFCIINLVARHTGKLIEAVPEEGAESPATTRHHKVDFGIIKLYTTRMFAESPARIRSAVELLSKINLLSMHMMVNDDGDEELDHVVIKNLQLIEDFAEFYQYNLYKGSKSEIIYIDPLAHKVANALVEMGLGLEKDHKGAVALDFAKVRETLKKKYRIDLNNTHLDSLERKGLFTTRKPRGEEGTDLKFDIDEFVRVNGFWNIIAEIDKWNEKGFVDLNEQTSLYGDEDTSGCPQCSTEILEEHKFCPECGFKLAG